MSAALLRAGIAASVGNTKMNATLNSANLGNITKWKKEKGGKLVTVT